MDARKDVERAVAIGESNKRVLELLKNWCAHLKVEKQGAGGLVEQLTNLPVGPRYLTCPHAAASGFAGSDLKFIALDFHDRNCVGCANRKAVGFPNLSTLVHERDAAHVATRAETARRDAAALAALQERDAKRRAIRALLTPPSANVIDQIEELDHRRDTSNANRLVETARLAPEVFTADLAQYAFELLEGRESWFDDAGLRLLKILNADRSRLTRCALQSIARRGAPEIAAEIVIENLGFADEALVGPAMPTLISMAYPRHFPFAQTNRQPDPTPLQRVHEAFPKAVEAAISALFDSSDPYDAS